MEAGLERKNVCIWGHKRKQENHLTTEQPPENIVQTLSHVRLFATPWTVHGILQARRLGLSFPSPQDLPNPGIETACPASPVLAGGSLTTELPGKDTWNPPISKTFSLSGKICTFRQGKKSIHSETLTSEEKQHQKGDISMEINRWRFVLFF